ncbi:uncharacterized protein BN762_02230 [Bacteroides sp. CAG:714]|nr:uncharacterized protein BN762_02230 [Bacteroides sp. CAG:714]
MADRVFVGHAGRVGLALFGGDSRNLGIFCRRNNVDGHIHRSAFGLVHYDHHVLVFAERYFLDAVLAVGGSENQHVSQSGRQRSVSAFVAGSFGYGEVFGIVVYLELDVGAAYRLLVFIDNGNVHLGAGGIVVDDVDFGEVGSLLHHVFRSVVSAEYLGVHQHTAAGGSVEPAQIQYRFRFAGTQEMPLSVYPGFYPGVVVVGVCPARCIYLACRNTYRTQCGYQEGGFLAATAVGSLDCSHRGAGTDIGRLVYHLFMAPVVHLQYGIEHGQVLYTGPQFLAEYLACIVQVFVVDPDGQNEMTEYQVRNGLSPGTFLAELEGLAYVVQVEFA